MEHFPCPIRSGKRSRPHQMASTGAMSLRSMNSGTRNEVEQRSKTKSPLRRRNSGRRLLSSGSTIFGRPSRNCGKNEMHGVSRRRDLR